MKQTSKKSSTGETKHLSVSEKDQCKSEVTAVEFSRTKDTFQNVIFKCKSKLSPGWDVLWFGGFWYFFKNNSETF